MILTALFWTCPSLFRIDDQAVDANVSLGSINILKMVDQMTVVYRVNFMLSLESRLQPQ